MRRITALLGSMRRRRPHGAYFTNTPPLPPFSSSRNPMFIMGSLFLSSNSLNRELACCNNKLALLPIKKSGIGRYHHVHSSAKGMCCFEASFTVGRWVSGRVLTEFQYGWVWSSGGVLTKLQRLYVFFKRLLRWDVEMGEGRG